MILQISSGMGPIECRAAVGGIFRALSIEYPDIEMITSTRGEVAGAYSSIVFQSDQDLSCLVGTMEWICKSRYRLGHKRKNWFVDVSMLEESEELDGRITSDTIKIERFHSGGHGGQNVNKVETGVRIIHLPTNITVCSTKERSQYANKQDALKKISAILKQTKDDSNSKNKTSAWEKHSQIVRGNPIRVYEGESFKLVYVKEEETQEL